MKMRYRLAGACHPSLDNVTKVTARRSFLAQDSLSLGEAPHVAANCVEGPLAVYRGWKPSMYVVPEAKP